MERKILLALGFKIPVKNIFDKTLVNLKLLIRDCENCGQEINFKKDYENQILYLCKMIQYSDSIVNLDYDITSVAILGLVVGCFKIINSDNSYLFNALFLSK